LPSIQILFSNFFFTLCKGLAMQFVMPPEGSKKGKNGKKGKKNFLPFLPFLPFLLPSSGAVQ